MPVWGRRVLAVAGIVLVLAAVAVFMFPTREVLAQRAEIGAVSREVDDLNATNERLANEIERLQTDEELERLARRAGYVRPGEEMYRVLPPEGAGLYLPGLWPFNDLRSGSGTDAG